MRPKTIVYFEWIIFGMLLVSVLQTYLTWDQIVQAVSYYDSSTATILTIIILSFVLFGVLTLLISRRRSKIAMWVSIAWFALYLAFLALFVSDIILGVQFQTDDIITLAVLVGEGIAYGLLFTPSARHWMSDLVENDPNRSAPVLLAKNRT